jgi:pimeloyl-ACP methyl ester carboxylesterase
MELLQLWIFAPPYYEHQLNELKNGQSAALTNTHPQSADGFEEQLDACIHHDTVELLHEIKVPTLVTIGMMDIFTPPAFSELLHNKIPNAEIVRFPTGGHVHHWEDLERFNKVTLDFLLDQTTS